MAKKYPKSEMVNSIIRADEPAFLYYEADNKAEVFKESAKSLSEYIGISRADTRFNDFSNLLPGISGRPGLTRDGYNAFRPDDASPSRHRDIILRCNDIYQGVGLIQNVINLMGDFTSQGIRLTHQNKKIEKFFNNWFKKVGGPERTERMANYLYRSGTAIVRKQTAKISVRTSDKLYKTSADPDLKNEDVQPVYKTEKREIPWRYTFLDPATVVTVGGTLSSFVGNPRYAIVLPDKIRRQIISPKTDVEKQIVEMLPEDIKNAAKKRTPYILPAEKTVVVHFKKDDWDEWAYPIIYSIFKDAVAYEKMKLADIAALDGAISNIRIFTIGDVANKIMPTAYAAAKLAEILQSHTGGGTMDIIWGQDLKLQETKSEVYKFLGEDKYKPILNALYAGLGIPPTLTGTYGAAGTTNNFISLKTLTERLEYGRARIIEFWEKEIAIVQEAMGFRFPAQIEFDLMNLGDEQSILKLYMDLADRLMISDETLQKVFKQDPEMERLRINREAKDRDAGRRVGKTGPFFEPEPDESLKKIALQQGVVTPSQLGLDLPPPKEGEVPMIDKKHEQDMKKQELANKQKIAQQKMKGKPGQGRPAGKKDSTKRKTKTFKPRSKAATIIWANRAQAEIAEILNPGLLATYGKKNFRMLSTSETEEVERIKFGVLSEIEPFTTITAEVVKGALNFSSTYSEMSKLYRKHLSQVLGENGETLSLDDIKQIQSCVYADYYGGNDE